MSTESYGNVATYDGEYYDSLTEARWGAYCKLAGMPAISQPETFQLNPSTIYTPDFYLPEQDSYLEVKNGNADWFACNKARLLAIAVRRTVILVDGSPSNLAVYFFSPDSNREAPYNLPFPANGFADAHLFRRELFEGGQPRSDDARKIIELATIADGLPTIGASEAVREVARMRKIYLKQNIRKTYN